MMQSPTRDYTSFLSFLPSSDNHGLRQAFYNTLAILIVLLVGAAGFAVYCILEVFVKPLLWALLVGVCLHPFKRRLTNTLRRWLHSLDTSGTPLALSLATLPISTISYTAEFVFSSLVKYAKIILFFFIALPMSYFFYHYGPLNRLLTLLVYSLDLISSVMNWFSTFWFLTLILGYLGAVLFFWNQETAVWLRRLSIPVWILMIIHVASITGSLRVPLFLVFMFLLIVGRVSLIGRDRVNKARPSGLTEVHHFVWKYLRPKTHSEDLKPSSENQMNKDAIEEEAEEHEDNGNGNGEQETSVNSESNTDAEKGDASQESFPETMISSTFYASDKHGSSPELQTSSDTPSSRRLSPKRGKENRRLSSVKKSPSFPYFICLFWAHIAVYLWTQTWVVQLLPVPLLVVMVKKICSALGGRAALRHYLMIIYLKAEVWLGDRVDALAPAPIRGIFKLLLRGDKKICRLLDSTLDSVVSIFVILLVFFGTIALTLFLAFQINRESVQLVTMTSQVLNNTMHSDLLNWMPQKEKVQQLVESTIGNAYVFGREWISRKIEQFFNTDSYNKAKIEEQVLELWDRLYQRVIYKNVTTNREGHTFMKGTSFSSLPATVHGLWETLWTFELLSVTHIMEFVKENIGIFTSVFESIWTLLKGNLSLCLSFISAIFSIILGGSTALLNFLLSTIIFTTTLFYLLAFSRNNFLPLELVGQCFDTPSASPYIANVYQAVQLGVSGVFMASLKMAVFYGFYTHLTHLVFGVSLVVIPSVLAALFAAVPFLGTYWAALPAIIELSLVSQEPGMGIALLACHLLPTYFVDISIYKEIQGAGHPYLTGLAVAGGIYYFGLEGAIMGPILLCFLLVAVNLYSTLLVSDSSSGFSARKKQFTRSHSVSGYI